MVNKIFIYLAATFFPTILYAYDGCPGTNFRVDGSCVTVDRAVNFPSNASVSNPEDIRSSPENPMIIGGFGPKSLTFSSVQGPWVIQTPTSITANSFSNWPYIEAPVEVVMFGQLPSGEFQPSPGLNCSVYKASTSLVYISCHLKN